jgi:phosphoglycolate phosphatase
MNKPRKHVLITDLDNTLWDWVAIWHAPFAAMVDAIVTKSGLSRELLLDEIRQVHQKHKTSEYAFLIEELPSLRAGCADPIETYGEAIDAFRQRRREVLRPYAGVIETLKSIRSSGAKVVGYTESMAYYSEYRLRRTGIAELLDCLYSPADHDLPRPRESLRKYSADSYGLPIPHLHTPPGELKPNPALLADILRQLGVGPETAIYVGDSLTKDVAMAQHAGVLDVHARYGLSQHTDAYQLLRRVSHWSDEEIEREKQNLKAPPHRPSIELFDSFAQILDAVEFS